MGVTLRWAWLKKRWGGCGEVVVWWQKGTQSSEEAEAMHAFVSFLEQLQAEYHDALRY